MTKQKIDGKMIVTKTAEDYTLGGMLTPEEVDFRDMQKQSFESAAILCQEKKNFEIEFFPLEKKIVMTWDLA